VVTFTDIVYDNGAWTYTWATGLGTVRVVLWGETIDTTTENSYTLSGANVTSATAAPPLEVVVEGERAVSEENVCFLLLQWHTVVCSRYVIERKNGATWEIYCSIQNHALGPIVSLTTPVLPDQTVAEWRVTAVDENKREGAPLNFEWKIVRPPNPVSVSELSCVSGTLAVQ
jgi:hypothetical protein